MPEFSATRLTLARERRGLTRKYLAESIGVSSQIITAYEDGTRHPAEDKIPHIASILEFPTTFFLCEEVELTPASAVSFRSRHALKASQRDKALRTSDIAAQVISPVLRKRFRFPAVEVPDLSAEGPEGAARILRDIWKLGLGPIHNMVHLLESKGTEIYWLHEPSPCLDAFCFWRNDFPYIMLNSSVMAGDRCRFNLAHELGHLVLHRHEQKMDCANLEEQADQFASAFLLPFDAFRYESPRYPVINEYLPLKTRWGVSIQAMIRRGRDMGVFNDWYYEKAFKHLSSMGWRLDEPVRLPRESSLLHKLVFDGLASRKQTPIDFAQIVNLTLFDVAEMLPVTEEFVDVKSIMQSVSVKEFVYDDFVLRLIE